MLVAVPGRAESSELGLTAAQERYRDAYAAIDHKDWSTARELLLELWDRAQTHDVAISLGMVEHNLGNMAASARYVAFAVANVPPAEKRETVAAYKRALTEARRHVATLWVTVTPADAQLFVDGAAAELPARNSLVGLREVFVDPGERTVEARSASGASASKVLQARAGDEQKLELTVAGGALSSSAVPPEDAGHPPREVEPASQAHVPSEAPERRSWVPAYVLGGVTVAGLATSLVFRGLASSEETDANQLQKDVGRDGCTGSSTADCRALADTVERHDARAQVSNVALVVTGVGAAATAGYVLYVLLQPRTEAPVRATVGFDGTSGSLLVTGSF